MSNIGHEELEVESIVESQGSNSSRKRKAYSIEKKLEAIDYAKKFKSKKAASDKFGISRSTVQDWVKQEEELRVMSKNSKRLAGAGRHLTFAELDVELANWVREQKAGKKKVSRRILKQQAVKIFVQDDESDKEFKASEGWLQKFMDRYKFRSRVPTTVCQKPPIEYKEALVKFVMYSYIFARDETAVWLDPSGGKCVAEKGAKEVSVLTTGHDKLRITVMLTARSDGYKCMPYVLLPRKRQDPVIVEKFKGKLQLAWQGTNWMNDQLTADYLQRVMGQSLFAKRLLVWDSFRCHISQATKKLLKWCKLDTAVIPGGCTKFVQAPDVCWNAPFKSKFRQFYEDWMMHADKELTKAGNPKAVSIAVYLQWIVDAWESLPTTLISNSFKVCGITNATDGSEDDQIHCFQRDGSVPTGRVKLQRARNDKELAELLEEIDLEEEQGMFDDDSDVSLDS